MAKTIFITGASRGFGRIWTEAFLQRGDNVVAVANEHQVIIIPLSTSEYLLSNQFIEIGSRSLFCRIDIAACI